MNIEITGRHVRITRDLEGYARTKAEKVAKFMKEGVRVEVILDHEHDKFQVEMIVSGYRGAVIVGHVQHDEPKAAVDLAIDKIEHQLRRFKDRRKQHRGESLAGEKTGVPIAEDSDVSYDDIIDEELNQ